jgi:hypothetical protein
VKEWQVSQFGIKRARPGPGGRASSGNLDCPVFVGTTAAVVGVLVGATVGAVVGATVGAVVDVAVGAFVGATVGAAIGATGGGALVGTAVGTAVGVGGAEQAVANISTAMTTSMIMNDGIQCINLGS